MKNDSLIQDSLQLAKNISNSAPPTTQWIIVNIARDTSRDSLQPFLQYVSTVYFYHYDAVPQFLEQEGVIEEKVENKWFQKVVQYSKLQQEYSIQIMYDRISSYAKRKGYLAQGQKAVYFDNRSGHIEDYGPQLNGQHAVLVNKSNLHQFIKKYSTNFPDQRDFYYENGELHIKLQDGSDCTLDLSKADILRPIFESFYFLYKDSNKKLFKREELLTKYKELTDQEIEWQIFIKRKSSIVGKMINTKDCLKNRIVWGHDKQTDQYKFEILLLSDK